MREGCAGHRVRLRPRTGRSVRRSGRSPADGGDSSTAASTTEVTAAANCWPRGSICGIEGSCPGWVSAGPTTTVARDHREVERDSHQTIVDHSTRQRERVWVVPSGHSTQRRPHAAVVHCAAPGQHGRGHARNTRGEREGPGNSRLTSRNEYPHHGLASASAPSTCSLRGAPAARLTSRPSASRTSVVGVRRTRSRRTRSRWCSASISTWATPGTTAATSASVRLVARHGAQNAEENCSSVARSPSLASPGSGPTSAEGSPRAGRPVRCGVPPRCPHRARCRSRCGAAPRPSAPAGHVGRRRRS